MRTRGAGAQLHRSSTDKQTNTQTRERDKYIRYQIHQMRDTYEMKPIKIQFTKVERKAIKDMCTERGTKHN